MRQIHFGATGPEANRLQLVLSPIKHLVDPCNRAFKFGRRPMAAVFVERVRKAATVRALRAKTDKENIYSHSTWLLYSFALP